MSDLNPSGVWRSRLLSNEQMLRDIQYMLLSSRMGWWSKCKITFMPTKAAISEGTCLPGQQGSRWLPSKERTSIMMFSLRSGHPFIHSLLVRHPSNTISFYCHLSPYHCIVYCTALLFVLIFSNSHPHFISNTYSKSALTSHFPYGAATHFALWYFSCEGHCSEFTWIDLIDLINKRWNGT